jgi:CDP-diacylglycerol---glycerol-3-phosphate 3-phosphatidyltransferase
VFPMVEMGQLGIHHDSVITKRLLSSSLQDSEIKLATGYFNLTQNYMDTISNDCQASCNILMAHPSVSTSTATESFHPEKVKNVFIPQANGFQGAKGPAGGIPAAYTLIAKKFYQRLVNDNQHNRVSLSEYERPGWTYHAKGLWYYLPHTKLPALTVIGSSNFGERSVNRDLETQVCLVTHNRQLQLQLQGECDHLYKYGRTAEVAIVARPVPKWVKAVVWLFKNFF